MDNETRATLSTTLLILGFFMQVIVNWHALGLPESQHNVGEVIFWALVIGVFLGILLRFLVITHGSVK